MKFRKFCLSVLVGVCASCGLFAGPSFNADSISKMAYGGDISATASSSRTVAFGDRGGDDG